jgi:hypothetical protein
MASDLTPELVLKHRVSRSGMQNEGHRRPKARPAGDLLFPLRRREEGFLAAVPRHSGRHLKGRSYGGAAQSPDPRRRRCKTSLVVTTYAFLALALFHVMWFGHPASEMQRGSDQYNFVWALEWVPWALTHGHNPFFSNYLNYPYGVNLLTNAGITGLGVLFAPVTLLFGPIASFNVAETLGIALAATSGYFFALRFSPWRPAAFCAGLLYGFSPYELAQSSGHLNLSFIALPPLILLALHDITVRQQGSPRRAGIVLALVLIAQFFISTELLADTVLVGAIALTTGVLFGYRCLRSKFQYALRSFTWTIGVAGVVLAYPLWFALDGPAHIGGAIQLVPQAYRADLMGLIMPNSRQLITTSYVAHIANAFANSTTENGSYLGVPLLLVLLVSSLILWRINVVKVAALTLLAALVLSLGNGLVVYTEPPASLGGIPFPERLLADMPLIRNAIPARFALFVALFAALILAVTLERIHSWLRQRRPESHWLEFLGPTLLVLVCFVPLIPAPFRGIGPTVIPQFFTSSAIQQIAADSTVVVDPFPSDSVPDGALWEALSSMRFRQPGTTLLVPGGPNGNVAFSPAIGYDRSTLVAKTLIGMDEGRVPLESPDLRVSLRRQLHAWKVQSVVTVSHGNPSWSKSVGFFTWLFGQSPELSQGGIRGWLRLRL